MPVARARGPAIWLAGDPDDLREWMPLGIAGIVTNTVVHNQYAKAHGGAIDVIKKYLDLTGQAHRRRDRRALARRACWRWARRFTDLSDQIVLKIPCSTNALKAFAALREEGVETCCTTVFSLPQAVAVAQAGVDHILPFCEPVKEAGGDPTKLIRECAQVFGGWEQRPFIMAALVRTVETAYAAFRDGADELVTMWTVYRDMMDHPMTSQWNKVFMDAWQDMDRNGLLDGVPVRRE